MLGAKPKTIPQSVVDLLLQHNPTLRPEEIRLKSRVVVSLPCPSCHTPRSLQMRGILPKLVLGLVSVCKTCAAPSQKIAREKTSLERYGVPNAGGIPESLDKAKETFQKNHGVDWPMQSAAIREKSRQSFNANHPSGYDGIVQKRMETSRRRYGVDHPSQNLEVLGRSMTTRIQNYGTLNVGNSTGRSEQELLEFLNSYGHAFREDNSLAAPKQIDGYDPQLSLAVEYCGLYWHNEESSRPCGRMYHLDKMRRCESKGVSLLTIFEDEWRYRRQQVQGYLRSKIGSFDLRVYARTTTVRDVVWSTAKDLCEAWHIQGAPSGQVCAYILEHKGKPVGLMSFSKHHRGSNPGQIVLSRLAFAPGVMVVGGASRLLSHAEKSLQNMGYREIVSWSDNRWSRGNVYQRLGFFRDREYPPDYSYVCGPKRISKQACQKKFLRDRGAVGTTEREMAASLGLKRIWDCGKIRWVKKIA